MHCTGDPDLVSEGRKSFPSIHSSCKFVHMQYYFWGKKKKKAMGMFWNYSFYVRWWTWFFCRVTSVFSQPCQKFTSGNTVVNLWPFLISRTTWLCWEPQQNCQYCEVLFRVKENSVILKGYLVPNANLFVQLLFI